MDLFAAGQVSKLTCNCRGASLVDQLRLGHPMLLRIDTLQKGLQMNKFDMQQFLGMC